MDASAFLIQVFLVFSLHPFNLVPKTTAASQQMETLRLYKEQLQNKDRGIGGFVLSETETACLLLIKIYCKGGTAYEQKRHRLQDRCVGAATASTSPSPQLQTSLLLQVSVTFPALYVLVEVLSMLFYPEREKKILYPRRKISFQDTDVISSQDKLLVLLISFCGSKST